ncbi:formylglycine-generating enzyme family protein [Psychrobacter immobilis]|jgi:formylglycine-generating enzyme required for sulfatase activity|uniref:formylglycine-generating enzyme family protein n=1 Tax=Psychrobacter immobilis TaxID=498 RepID=UPI001917DBC3|nr:SUMF1/EgtB/PvdO family nonheme iron enzyme [Psychrobacter immobilis]
MILKPLLASLFILPLFTMAACAKEPATSANSSGVPQTRSDLTADEKQQLDEFLVQQKENMRFIEGGSFEMGDFGHKLDWTDGLPLTGQSDNKPLHPVTLDSFSINAYKATYGDFDVYSMATGQEEVGMQKNNIKIRQPSAAAGINWQTAQHYCQWLGQQLDIPMGLPTEAQWEYAARNRGQYVLFPTDTGDIDPERNMWTYEEQRKLSDKYNSFVLTVPIVGLYPPNPLGLYDLVNQNYEWMTDWYDPEYYANSPESNPQVSETGIKKVLRSVDATEGSAGNVRAGGAVTIKRFQREPNPPLISNNSNINQNRATSARCVANLSKPMS